LIKALGNNKDFLAIRLKYLKKSSTETKKREDKKGAKKDKNNPKIKKIIIKGTSHKTNKLDKGAIKENCPKLLIKIGAVINWTDKVRLKISKILIISFLHFIILNLKIILNKNSLNLG